MSASSKLSEKLAKSKKYREEFVAAHVKRGIPFQARALLRSRAGWTQETLARNAGITQGVVSRALDPNNGNLTLNTIIRIAAGFDVAFIGKFVPFSELGNWFLNLSEESLRVEDFQSELERRAFERLGETATLVERERPTLAASLASAHERRSQVICITEGLSGYSPKRVPIQESLQVGQITEGSETGGSAYAALGGRSC